MATFSQHKCDYQETPVEQEGCEFLFRETEDGRLDLRDAYVYYLDADMYLPPQVEGELPAMPLHYEELEWAAEFTGDTIKGKPPWKKARWSSGRAVTGL